MPIVREKGIFMLLIRVLNQFCTPIENSIPKIHRLKAAETLALLVETEDFSTHRSSYYVASDVDAMVELKECCLKDLLTDMDTRRTIRPLVDCIERAKRQMRSAAYKK